MKRLVSVLVITVLAAPYASAALSRERREADPEGKDTGVVGAVLDLATMTEGLPIVGGLFSYGITWISDTVSAVGDLSNGMIARILGGTLPCIISKEKGFTCTGVTDKNNVASLIMGLLDQSPLPNILKNTIRSVLGSTLDPMLNVIFGGVSIPSS